MYRLGSLLLLHALCANGLAAGLDSPLDRQLGGLEKRSSSGQKQRVVFSDLLAEFHAHIAACVGGFKPKVSGAVAEADAKAFQECVKRCFNENIQEPLMRKLYPDEQLSSCK